jgi:FixJ family two-component response regulator
MTDGAATPVVYVLTDADESTRPMAELERLGVIVRRFRGPSEVPSARPLQHPGCLVIDARAFARSGPALGDYVRGQRGRLPLIVVADRTNVPTVVEMMKAGAFDVLERPLQDGQLERCVLEAIKTDRAAQREEARRTEAKARLASLTHREAEVLRMVVDGKASSDIAAALGISPRTVEAHRSRLLQKLDVRSVADLVRFTLLAES